jgi:hypothetical protein
MLTMMIAQQAGLEPGEFVREDRQTAQVHTPGDRTPVMCRAEPLPAPGQTRYPVLTEATITNHSLTMTQWPAPCPVTGCHRRHCCARHDRNCPTATVGWSAWN